MSGDRYSVSFRGEFLVRNSRDPECDLARALLDRGIDGIIRVIDANSGRHRTTVNIEKAAKLTVEEGPYGPRFVKRKTVVDRASAGKTKRGGVR